MAFRQYAVMLPAAPPVLRLSSVLSTQADDVFYRQLIFQADASNVGAVYIGDGDLVAPDNAAFVLQPGPDKVLIVTLGPFDVGVMKLSDFWAVGNGGTPRLLISGIPLIAGIP